MLSPSLFLGSSTTLVSVLALLSVPVSADLQYVQKKNYQGQDFVNDFAFWDQKDPTHGYVTYSNKDTSIQDGRVTFNNGRFQMRVQSNGVTGNYIYDQYKDTNGVGRGSVRIESRDTWTKGLFVADIEHLPERQCGIWPAWWTLGTTKDWPQGGEIDIVEGVHKENRNLAALHTSGESVMSTAGGLYTGETKGTDCRLSSGGSAGCAIKDYDGNSFGSPVGGTNGRTIAMEWTSDSIKVWNFARNARPNDILGANPDPSQWGTPSQQFTGGVNIDQNFVSHKMIFNTALCGDWA